MNKAVHQVSGSIAFLLALLGFWVLFSDVAKIPVNSAKSMAEAPIVPDDSETTELDIDGARWVIIKLWNTDKIKGLELFQPGVEPDINLTVVTNRIERNDVTGFVFVQKDQKGREIYSYVATTSTGKPSVKFKDYYLNPINKKYLANHQSLEKELNKRTTKGGF